MKKIDQSRKMGILFTLISLILGMTVIVVLLTKGHYPTFPQKMAGRSSSGQKQSADLKTLSPRPDRSADMLAEEWFFNDLKKMRYAVPASWKLLAELSDKDRICYRDDHLFFQIISQESKGISFGNIDEWIDTFLSANSPGHQLVSKGLYTLQDYPAIRFSYLGSSEGKEAVIHAASINAPDCIYTVVLAQYDNMNYNNAYTHILKNLSFPSSQKAASTEPAGNSSDKAAASGNTASPSAEDSQTTTTTIIEEYASVDGDNEEYADALIDAGRFLDYRPYSKPGLASQLEFVGYTQEAAQFAADHCGGDWNEMAAIRAEEYLSFSPFSEAALIKQLEFEGYTREEAEYAIKKSYR